MAARAEANVVGARAGRTLADAARTRLGTTQGKATTWCAIHGVLVIHGVQDDRVARGGSASRAGSTGGESAPGRRPVAHDGEHGDKLRHDASQVTQLSP